MNEQEATYLFQEFYDTTAGIHNYQRADAHPFGGLVLHEGTNPYIDGPLRDLVNEYVEENYGEIFKLSLLEFLDLPMPYLEILRQVIRDPSTKTKNSNRELEELAKSLKNTNK